uniref:Uncharacterized protein n=1 Tax=uncultured Microgenomates bacterium Rifle_16ft_4_minimus_37906 TaxID=1665116 RepID=A0A0H4T633_9BACT|nr:Uncharacterized protein [uncultured Microgenomates bacterium Rifle_16ft_4_minimus_37906]
MTSLTRISVTARKIIRYSVFFVIFLIIAKILFDLGSGIYRKVFPAPPPPPTVSFGKLSKLPFPEAQKPNLTYSLETAEGGLPTLPTQAKVFFMPKLSANLLSLDVAKNNASGLNFNPAEQEVSQTVYKFAHKANPQTLEINIVTGVFSISYDLKADSSPIQRRPPSPEVAASLVRAYLSSAELLPEDLSGPTTHEFLKIEGDKFVFAVSLSESQLVKVNLFRKTYDNLPVFTPDPNTAKFHYFPVDESQSSTYPIKTAQEAWDELTAGQAFVAAPGLNKDGDKVTIRKIYLGYFDPGTPTEFFQPLVVFEGDRGFMAYLPAVTPQYYGD